VKRVDPKNKPLIRACDFIGTDEYPYWQGATIPQSAEVFWDSVQEVIDAANEVKVSSLLSNI
jgi:exo-beta-1,3-glucanase (GH17 family)